MVFEVRGGKNKKEGKALIKIKPKLSHPKYLSTIKKISGSDKTQIIAPKAGVGVSGWSHWWGKVRGGWWRVGGKVRGGWNIVVEISKVRY